MEHEMEKLSRTLWKYALLSMAVLLLAVSVAQAYQIAGVGKVQVDTSAAGGIGAIDTRGWTADEIMNYEMHGIIPARTKGGAASSQGAQMVGGC